MYYKTLVINHIIYSQWTPQLKWGPTRNWITCLYGGSNRRVQVLKKGGGICAFTWLWLGFQQSIPIDRVAIVDRIDRVAIIDRIDRVVIVDLRHYLAGWHDCQCRHVKRVEWLRLWFRVMFRWLELLSTPVDPVQSYPMIYLFFFNFAPTWK